MAKIYCENSSAAAVFGVSLREFYRLRYEGLIEIPSFEIEAENHGRSKTFYLRSEVEAAAQRYWASRN